VQLDTGVGLTGSIGFRDQFLDIQYRTQNSLENKSA
jgi:hypothetical protein